MGEVHNTIKDRLMEVHAELKKWKNDNYKKQMVVAGCKEAKQFEDDFRKVALLTILFYLQNIQSVSHYTFVYSFSQSVSVPLFIHSFSQSVSVPLFIH